MLKYSNLKYEPNNCRERGSVSNDRAGNGFIGYCKGCAAFKFQIDEIAVKYLTFLYIEAMCCVMIILAMTTTMKPTLFSGPSAVVV